MGVRQTSEAEKEVLVNCYKGNNSGVSVYEFDSSINLQRVRRPVDVKAKQS